MMGQASKTDENDQKFFKNKAKRVCDNAVTKKELLSRLHTAKLGYLYC